jgi:putative ABC transport system permease protein
MASLSAIWHDLRIAGRGLTRQPVSSAVVVGILALGIAGTTTVFNLLNGLFLRPLPVPAQERLVDLNETAPKMGSEYVGLSYPHFHTWRQYNETFECMAARTFWWANLSIEGRAERIHGLRTTHDLFDVLGIRPLLGRPFTAQEDRPGGPNVLLLSYGLWERLFAKDTSVVGRMLLLDGDPFTIIGVLPREGAFPEQRDVWLPLRGDPALREGLRYGLTAGLGIGRLKKGVTIEQARADLTRIHRAWLEQHPDEESTVPTVVNWRQRYLGQYRLGTAVLLGVAVLLLLTACANAAGIILTRGTYRSKEVATRSALGATRHRIVQLVLGESLLLSLAGAILGALLGHYALGILLAPLAEGIPTWMKFQPDIHCVFFCLGMVAATTLLAGLLPALHAAFPRDLHATLQALGNRATPSHGRRRALNAIVVAQVALALTLLIGAALLLQAFRQVQNVDPGFRTAGILTYHIPLTTGSYVQDSRRRAFWEQHFEKVRALPGVVRASLSSNLPLTWQEQNHFDIEGAPPPGPGEPDPVILTRSVMPGYFETLGIRLLSGRLFTEQDTRPDGRQTAIVNESFARRFWPDENPLDKRIRLRDANQWSRVVGVVEDTSDRVLDEPMRPCVHLPADLGARAGMFGVVLTSRDPLSLVGPIRGIVRAADPGLPVEQVRTMAQRVDQSMLLRRLYAWLVGLPAVAAGLMACAGIYSVISYWAGRRTREIGIRMAFGARSRDVALMVMRQGLRLILTGVGLGLLGAYILGRLLGSLGNLLYHVNPTDPRTFLGVPALLLTVAVLACYLPARRAARIDPMVALRYE